tara:strand:- start:895 stop:1299 length:405 start_codon:yes stop_codon:yes gene_type:complete
MKDWLKKVTGFDKEQKKLESLKKEVEEQENKLLKKKDPKALATKKGEPWVNVLDVQVNKDNIRNGFFELDWNKHFIEQLIKEGYGEEADPEEEIVDRWFRDIVYNMLQEEGLDTNRSAGYINVIPIDKGKSQVS